VNTNPLLEFCIFALSMDKIEDDVESASEN